MNKRERLIAETFGDDEGAAFARTAAAHARRRRGGRLLAATVAAAAMVAAVLISLHRPPPASPQPMAGVRLPVSTVEIISDDELRAHLRDQPVLFLKDQTGITGVIFLAKASATASEAEFIPQ